MPPLPPQPFLALLAAHFYSKHHAMKVAAGPRAAAAALALVCCAALLPAAGAGRVAWQGHRALQQAVDQPAGTHAPFWDTPAGSPPSEAAPLLVRAFQGPTDGASAAQLLQGAAGGLGSLGAAAAANSSACPCRDDPPPNGDCIQQRDAGQW